MRYHIYTLSLLLIISGKCFSQAGQVTNIRIRLDTTGKIRILYDLSWIKSSDSIYLEARGKQSGQLKIRTIEGDIGQRQDSGRNKSASWDIVKDGYLIDEEIQISILIKPQGKLTSLPTNSAIGGGPSNALLSAVLPGVGNIFVQPKAKKHRVGFRPLLPIAFYGLAGFSVYNWLQARDRYEVYNQQIREEVAQPIYDDANDLRHQAILAAGAAAAIWTIDVGCTLFKGISNNKKRRITQSVSLGVLNGVPVVGLSIKL